AEPLLDAEPHQRAERAAEELAARRHRRIGAEVLPELEHLARRLPGRDDRRAVGEARIFQEPLVGADLERAAGAAAGEHEPERPPPPSECTHHPRNLPPAPG